LLITDRVLKYIAVFYNGFFIISDWLGAGFELVKNKGIGLSIGLPVWISAPLTIIFLGYLGWVLYQQLARQKKINNIQIIAFVLIIIGGLSNLIDRLFYSYVIDYFVIDVTSRAFAFNIADMMVVVGVFLLMVHQCWVRTGSPHPRTAERILALNKTTYNKIAAQFSQTRKKPLWPELYQFKQYIKDNDKILDIGCGNGRLLELFDDVRVDYIGIDTSQKLLDQAQKNVKNFNSKIKFIQGDMLKLNVGNNFFDAVFMIASLHHLPARYHAKALKEAYRVLKQGRHLLMTNFNLWQFSLKGKTVWRYKVLGKNVITLWNKHPLYYYAFTLRELKRKCRKAGFKIKKAYYAKAGKSAHFYNGHNLVLVLEK